MNQAIPVREPLISIPQPTAANIVSAIYDIGDFMKEELAKLNFISNNHKSGLFWGKLNTDVYKVTGLSGGEPNIVRAGYHDFLLVGHDALKLTFMRESRFRDVQAEVKAKGKLNYQNLLVQQYNIGLEADVAQLALYPIHEYDKAELSKRFNKMFGGVLSSNYDVGYYVMILFNFDSYVELRRIKAVIVDPDFDIVEEQDWSHLIPVRETTIAEKVLDIASPSNNPSRGMTLTPKALVRKRQQSEVPPENDEK